MSIGAAGSFGAAGSIRRAGARPSRTAAWGLCAMTIAAMVSSAVGAPSAVGATAVPVTVNATAGLGAIPSNAIGLNTAVYDGNMNDAAAPGLIKAGGFTALRYPGGSYSDIYNWQTNVAQGGYDAPNTSFSAFMGTARSAGTSPVITVNYGTGTPALAAAWVQNANVTNQYGITWWEVGNEVYGNGTYGANWEADSHCTNASGTPVTVGSAPAQTYNCGPAVYAAGVLSYLSAMKAASSNIHVCAVLTTPGYWPDNVTNATTSPKSWNQTVLTALGAKTDCVIVHYYPAYGSSDVAAMLAATKGIPGIVSAVKSQVQQYAGVNPANVPVIVTEANSSIATNTQPGALFAADMYMSWLESGVTNVDWWDQHNGPGTPSVVAGAQDYGDFGILSSGGNASGVTEPPLDTPFAPYYGVQLLSKLGVAGDTMVGSVSGNPLVRVHAVRRADGTLTVLIENEDPTNSYTAGLTYNGFTPSAGATVYSFVNKGTAITSATQTSASSVTVAPYSLTVLQVAGSGGAVATAPGTPGQPVASGLSSSTSSTTSGTATLTWTASTAGTYPVAGYQLYQVTSTGSTLLASPTGTSYSLSGLTIGAAYSYYVVAVDTHGNPSSPSSPVTFTVPPPADATCAVHFAVPSSWSGGFTGSVTMTNRAATAISGWKLTFTWPVTTEALQSGWNGTWTQSGQTVTVTDAGWNGTLAAGGGSVTIGFNGTSSSGVVAPAAFYLNGTICSTV
jgi:Cellulose binding domain/Fibronectin type III domain